MATSKKASNGKKKRSIIVDRKQNTPYHLKSRSTNIANSKLVKVFAVVMILAMTIGVVVGVLAAILN